MIKSAVLDMQWDVFSAIIYYEENHHHLKKDQFVSDAFETMVMKFQPFQKFPGNFFSM